MKKNENGSRECRHVNRYPETLRRIPLIAGLLLALVAAIAVTTVPSYSQTGLPSIAGVISGQGFHSSGSLFVDLRLTNQGTGLARNIRINQLPLRTLSGSGTVSYNAELSPTLPFAAGDLAPGSFTTIRLYLAVPPTVTRFSITENGTVEDSVGTVRAFSISESVIPPINKAPTANAGPDLTITQPNAATLNGSSTDDGLPMGSILATTWTKASGPGTVSFTNANAASTSATFSLSGDYVLRLTATDGTLSSFDDVNVRVNPANLAPVVGAGPDLTITLPDGATLNGTATDDGLPTGSTLTSTWTKTSGPGTVSFTNPNAASTSATFSLSGDYVLRLTATDGTLSSFDDVNVRVNPANLAPVVGAGPDLTITLPDGATLNGTATDDGLPTGSTLTSTWTKTSGPGAVSFTNANAASTSATFSLSGDYVLRLTATDSAFTTFDEVNVRVNPANLAPVVGAGPDLTITLPDAATLNGSATDDGLPTGSTLTSTWTKSSGPGTVSFTNPNAASTSATFSLSGDYVLRLTATDGTLSSFDDVNVRVNPANQAPLVGAGPDLTITLPDAATLNGSATDDGLPTGSTLTSTWTKSSGPGTVSFTNANAASTSATFSLSGDYVLRLTATDSALTTFDEVNVRVNPANQAPVVGAGPDLTITLPDAATLNGSATDDGLPTGSTLTSTWTKSSGPGTVSFTNANAASTSATFSLSGDYVLRLTATDGALTTFDEVNVHVNAAAVNQPPVVNAGADQSVTLPNRATLNGSVTDDGLPSPGTLGISWTKFSGPGNVTFTAPNAASTLAGFSIAGTYVLRLTGNDGLLSRFDDVQVQVSGTPPAAPTVALSQPANGTAVTTLTNVTGSVNSSSLDSWTLEFKMKDDPTFKTIATGTTTVSNALLGVFDPTQVFNGTFDLRLRATDTTGQTATTQISLIVTGNQKVGNFSVSFRDLTVPMAGFPIDIVRTYDSRLQRAGDFGVGWTLDLKAVQLAENQILGNDWQVTKTGSIFLPNYCVVETKPHVVTITLQDGTVHKFQPVISQPCQQVQPPEIITMGFQPMAGTNASLSIGAFDIFVVGSSPGPVVLLDIDTVAPVDPDNYTYSLPDGRSMQIDQAAGGLQSVTDASGNRITIGPNGLTHSAGKSVVFQRDAFSRITRITDPAGNTLNYAYDLLGNLVSFTDQENNTTTYLYNNTHGLLEIRDPRGIQPIRNEYDASGKLLRTIDAFGNVVNFTHNIGTREEITTDRLGHITLQAYDTAGNIVSTTDSLGNVTTRTFDARNNITGEVLPLGRTLSFTYDAQDNRLTETDPLGNTTRYTYNSHKQALTQTDSLGRVTTNTYDANENLLSTRDPLNNTTSFTYNSQGLRTSMTDPLGGTTQYQYDSTGNLTRIVDPLGRATTYTYDANGNRLSETKTRTVSTVSDTLTTTFQYDRLNRLVKTTFPDGSITQIAYDSIGKQSVTTDQLGRQTTFVYDAMGRLTQTTFPDGSTATATYDAEGRRTSVNNAGHTTSFQYDNLGRLLQTAFPDGTFATTTYDAAGRVSQTTDELGHVTKFTYDAAGRRTQVIDSLNQVTTFAYDTFGNQTSVTDARGNVTLFQYDANNRRTRVTFPDGTFEATTYDALDRSIAKTDQAGRTTQYQYDALGRLTRVTDALTQATIYTYDEVGNRLTQTDAAGRITRFEYDRLGRRISRTLPLGMTERWSYDAAGNQIARTDFNGKVTIYTYDSMNRIINKTPVPSLGETGVSFSYTATGQRASMTDASGPTSYLYDARGRLTQKATPQGTLSYTYDGHGNLATIRSSNTNGATVDYAYDALNRLSAVRDNRLSPGITTYNYDAAGNLSSFLYPNGVQHAYTYNSLNRLTNLSLTTGVAPIASYGYTLGPTGNRTSVVELGGRQANYTYDALYRLTNETIAGGSINGSVGYIYDAVGNRLQRTSTVAPVPAQTLTYDANDRLTTDTYDPNGNTSASGGNVFAYNFENRLSSRNGNEVGVVYDGDGNRVAKTVAGVTTRYLVDDRNPTGYAQVLEEISGSAVQRVYTYGLTLISQNLTSAGTSFYGFDGHGSVRLLTDAAGAVTDTYTYDAFGNIIARSGTTPNNYLFAGEQFDNDLGLYYNRARYMDVRTGRFWGLDRVDGNDEDPISLHRYLYANADAVNRLDPSGNQSLGDISLSIAIQGQLFVMAHPVLTAVISAVVLALAPEDFLNALPPQFGAEASFVQGVAAEARELTVVRRAYESATGVARMKAGKDFERWMIEEVLAKIAPEAEQLVIKDGQVVANQARIAGSSIIDAVYRGVITEFKTSFGAAKKYQAQQFAKFAQSNGMSVNYTFLVKPTPEEIATLRRWVAEVAQGVEVSVSYVIPK